MIAYYDTVSISVLFKTNYLPRYFQMRLFPIFICGSGLITSMIPNRGTRAHKSTSGAAKYYICSLYCCSTAYGASGCCFETSKGTAI